MGVAWLLATHKERIGWKRIKRVEIWAYYELYSGSDEDDEASSGDDMMRDGSGSVGSMGSRRVRRASDPGSIEAEPVNILVVTEEIKGDPHQGGGDEEMPDAPPK